MTKTENKYIEAKDSPVHRTGIFAKINIPTGARIIEYVGEIISKEEGTKRYKESEARYYNDPENQAGTYIFELDDEHDIDGDVPENIARFINHSCEPNCDIEIKDGHIWIIALRDVVAGEELNYNYGYDFDEADYFKHPCLCGSKNCAGYIVDPSEWHKIPKKK